MPGARPPHPPRRPGARPGRPGAWRRRLALALGVLLGHLWLLSGWPLPPQPATAPLRVVVAVPRPDARPVAHPHPQRPLQVPMPAGVPGAPVAAPWPVSVHMPMHMPERGAPAAARPSVRAGTQPPPPPPVPPRPRQAGATATAAATPSPPPAGARAAQGAVSADGLDEVVPSTAGTTASMGAAGMAPAAPGPGQTAAGPAAEYAAAAQPTAAEPPPLYAAQPPTPVRLRYSLRYGNETGQALLHWLPEPAATGPGSAGPAAAEPGHAAPARYSLRLDGHTAAGRPLVEQLSHGQLAAHGLVPERFIDRRRGRGATAAHFRRDIGRISFSGPQVDYPAWPGAQDRLSWLVQLVAIRAAAVAAQQGIPSELQLYVADARGRAELWRLAPLGPEVVDTALGALPTEAWGWAPARPDGLRVQAWLDPSRGHWPARVRFTALRSGDVFELLLAAEPEAP